MYIEPIPEFCKYLISRHFLNNLSCENAAVGQGSGGEQIVTMGALSTISRGVADAMRDIEWAKNLHESAYAQKVSLLTIHEIFKRNSVPELIDLLVVDTKGSEKEVMDQFFQSYRRVR